MDDVILRIINTYSNTTSWRVFGSISENMMVIIEIFSKKIIETYINIRVRFVREIIFNVRKKN